MSTSKQKIKFNGKLLLKWVVGILLTPILLMALLAALLYVPSVQDWTKNKVTSHLSEQTGMDIRIESLRLCFPFSLKLNNTCITQANDTLLQANELLLGVEITPLFQHTLALSDASVRDAKFNTLNFISNTQLKGNLRYFHIEIPANYNWQDEKAQLHSALLKNADISVILCDTAQADTTTKEPLNMTLNVQDINVQNTHIAIQMPGDSMRIATTLGKALVKQISAHLANNAYKVEEVKVEQSSVQYDIPPAQQLPQGFDYNHILLNELSALVDSICYENDALSARIKQLRFKEKSGLELANFSALVQYDSTQVQLKNALLQTPFSQVEANVSLPFNALQKGSKSSMQVSSKGNIGWEDISILAGDAVKPYKNILTHQPLSFNVQMGGNVNNLQVDNSTICLGGPKGTTLTAQGNLHNLLGTDAERRIQLNYKLQAGNMRAYKTFIPENFNLLSSILLNGDVSMQGTTVKTHSTLRSQGGLLNITASFNWKNEAYDILLKAKQFPLYKYITSPKLSALTASAHLQGKGFDFTRKQTKAQVDAFVQHLACEDIPLDSIRLNGQVQNNQAQGTLTCMNHMVNFATQMEAAFSTENIEANLRGTLADLAFEHLTNGQDSTHLSLDMKMRARVNLKENSFSGGTLMEHVKLITSTHTYPADSIGLRFTTCNDSTYAAMRSGDLRMKLYSHKDLNTILSGVSKFVEHLQEQAKMAQLNHNELCMDLPDVHLNMQAGKKNPVYQFLKIHNYTFNKFELNLNSLQEKGISGNMELTSFKNDKLLLDKTTLTLQSDSSRIRMVGNIKNSSKKNPNKFTANLEGELLPQGFSVHALFKDAKNITGMNIGVKGELTDGENLTMHLFPQNATIAYRNFKVNKDNFLTITQAQNILADIDLLADDDTGLKLNASYEDSINDITLSVNHVNISELCSVLPYMPNMGGFLKGDIHIIKQDSSFSASGSLNADQFRYESYKMGNIGTELAFLPKGSDEYYLNALLLSNEQEVGTLDGTYINKGEGFMDADITLEHFPCNFLNAFFPSDGTLALQGYSNGSICMVMQGNDFKVNGKLQSDSLQVLSPLYGVNLRVEDDELTITDSKLQIDTITMYSAQSKNPLTVDGAIDFSNLDKILINIAVKARNFQIVNAKRSADNILYGKIYSNIDATIRGNNNFIFVSGDLNILNNTNMTYVMKEGPLAVDEWLSGLVEFQDFSDTTTVKEETATSSKIMMTMNVNVADNTRINCLLSADGNSYFKCRGGGHLTLKYMPSGDMSLLGTFGMSSGEMKYELPFIPLKTFTLTGDNYITFTGKPFNPTLHITAMETTKANVSSDASSRMVTFNVGVAITQTLENMGLQFLIDAPNDMNVQNDLASMSNEDKSKLAITMLATGMYLSSSNKSVFKANNALNTFLQSEIQNLAGNALKSINLSVGVDGTTTQAGNSKTDYSFQFSQHLWNDRVTLIIGGKVSTGGEETDQNESFINNISLEYRLDKNATRNVKLFYDHDTQDPLEGTYTTAGAGFVLRRKTNTLGELILQPRIKKLLFKDTNK